MVHWKLTPEERQKLAQQRIEDFKNEQTAQNRRADRIVPLWSGYYGTAFAITTNQSSARIEYQPMYPNYR